MKNYGKIQDTHGEKRLNSEQLFKHQHKRLKHKDHHTGNKKHNQSHDE